LHPFNAAHFELVQLVVDNFSILHFLFVFFYELLTHFVVVFIHFHFFKFIPLTSNLLLNNLLSLFELQLHLSFLESVAHQHFAVECFDLVLSVVHVLVSFFNCLDSRLDLQFVFQSIHLSSFDFFFF